MEIEAWTSWEYLGNSKRSWDKDGINSAASKMESTQLSLRWN